MNLTSILLMLAANATVSPPQPEVTVGRFERFALVVGSNHSLEPGQDTLRYADDDAARMAELLAEAGTHVELVTTFDASSQRTFPAMAQRSRTATNANLWEGYARLRKQMERARASGAAVDLIIFYSGHGSVGPDGQPYLTLDDGMLTRTDLFERIIDASPADFNHLILDACQSETLVLSRGGDWKSDEASVSAAAKVRAYIDQQQLSAHPNLGVLLAHSNDQKTHEWNEYRAGIFTHEVASGLRGGADLNGDGSIEYSELGAFVSSANSGVADPRGRLEVVVVAPPTNQRRPILTHSPLERRRAVVLSQTGPWHYVLEDARGVRLADLHHTDESPAYLRLPAGDVHVHRRTGDASEEATVPAAWKGLISQSRLQFQPSRHASRGALDSAFRRGLFSVPFGPGYYFGYADTHDMVRVEDGWKITVVDEERDEKVVVEAEPESILERLSFQPWGSLFVGTTITPYSPDGQVDLDTRRVTSNRFRGCLSPLLDYQACSALRGLDLRWQFYWMREGEKSPRALVYFRTGYTAGFARFTPAPGDSVEGGTAPARSLAYMTVPLFVGGNLYAFDEFPVRPFAGAGFGFDVLRLDYRGFQDRPITDASARIGFELHAGIQARITKYISLSAEVTQLWSARRKIEGVPDFSNEGLTITTGVAVNFPLRGTSQKRARGKAPPDVVIEISRPSKSPPDAAGEPSHSDTPPPHVPSPADVQSTPTPAAPSGDASTGVDEPDGPH